MLAWIAAIWAAIKGGAIYLGIGALAVVIFLIRKSGADAEKLKQTQADLKAARTIAKERAEASGQSDAALNKEITRWTRKE